MLLKNSQQNKFMQPLSREKSIQSKTNFSKFTFFLD